MIKEIHNKIQKGEVKAVDLAKKYIVEILEKDDKLNVFLDIYRGEAVKNAQMVDDRAERGKKLDLLEGIPYALKDNMCVQKRRTTAASKMLEDYIAPYDATVVKKLKEKRGICLGKTNLDEYAMGASTENSAFGVTKNPYDESRVAGGSSGGSTAAVAADLAVWTLGSDTGGSIRLPASYCGVVGVRPTYGRVSRYGLIAMASSYDQIGPVTKTVEDAAIVLDAISGRDEKDNTTKEMERGLADNLKGDLSGKKIGLVKEFFGDELGGEVRKLIEERIEFAKSQGAEIKEVSLPHSKYALSVYYVMVPAEVSSNLGRLDGMRYGLSESEQEEKVLDVYRKSRVKGFGDETLRRVLLGTYVLSAGYYDAYYKKACQVREVIKKEVKEVFEQNDLDVLMAPSASSPAFKIGSKTDNPLDMYLADFYMMLASAALIPAMSIPAGMVEMEGKKLPVGLQVMAKWWDERNMFEVAKGLEL